VAVLIVVLKFPVTEEHLAMIS